ncbi:carbohydrate ABC transporter permease [uncultured Microbacterium sp.]|uniref:carbohydrate ABC transporter permease n=1 Tax=uncultured Microbacterium sp. TaxID=191216 RepID=UPI0035C99B14
MSGYDWDLLSPVREFIGFDNYTRMFSDETFWTAFRNTLVFTVVSTPLLIIVGLGLALLLNTKGRGRAVYRAAFFLPYVLPISAVTLIWSYLLNPDRGLIAGFLGWFGLDGIPFLSDPSLAMPSIIVTTVWWSVGFNMVLFLAGLQDIEPAYYEAASLDGAGWWQRFRHITVPGLSHVTILVTVTQFIASFQIFGQVYIMTRGGPGTSTIVLIQQIYEAGFKDYQLGYAAAISVFLFVIMAAVAAIQFRVMGKNS